ncbi:type I restriction enzyme EcoEI M protein [Clostridium pasteurianum DSM 525 = ATCC 6013]|uniref:site-specific DNA-methyltransferase (adenine-specific) n=1 Tax=Clostridium pasteurianum DSM 525 = ATCC 6013 TaxID=1262449 RepID=A0A0H3J623_CLOPA|nr:N-6 DNA methylase [Clostridium pasteurianum]AJA48914.1 type I restriction enzyme EcoEI M protein [Clostridium pasteurianum DSM 525 = ATCC 6013]AJA52902.1 type I restriction enzyme EcoEI M protein [Clostridium pasteurianum DSM 525 = ATCC 6013]AOZ76123.1 DNA methyltransferase [Clostridium pasteurianum DSM 525 = ATCC 6013]AOZ79919.1 DNA methyltransferase [Clostridium pasteurianum]ELP60210.1 type I restriction-modification system methyltransferase subunit HsdM [Clostridium pasteurianum DSM 525 
MLHTEIKSKIDKLWNNFWSGGISNPLTVIEQISYLLFIKRLDDIDTTNEKMANRMGKPFKSLFMELSEKLKKENKIKDDSNWELLKWSQFKHLEVEKMFEVVSQKVFPFIKSMGGEESSFTAEMKDAVFMIPKPSLLQESVRLIDGINMDDADTKGDLYEYLLSKLATSGVNGQFRTPRHIIRMMVELMDPSAEDKICDPACGTAGFLINSLEYILEKYTRSESVFTDEEGNIHNRIGDMMSPKDWDHFKKDMFYGFDFDASMVRIASMNLMLHSIDDPNVRQMDSLSKRYEEENKYTLVLANPPFKGSIDKEDINPSLLKGAKTTKTELLFIKLINRILDLGGRCAVIVPDGVLFGSTKAHKDIRKNLVEENQLEGVISMPSGVFKPYAGVSTAVLLFTKGGETNKVWFYDMESDGYSLDDKRNKLDTDGDIPDIIEKWRDIKKDNTLEPSKEDRWFWVEKEEIAGNDYDLSINKYKEIEYEEVVYEKPEVILERIEILEKSILENIAELKGMVK